MGASRTPKLLWTEDHVVLVHGCLQNSKSTWIWYMPRCPSLRLWVYEVNARARRACPRNLCAWTHDANIERLLRKRVFNLACAGTIPRSSSVLRSKLARFINTFISIALRGDLLISVCRLALPMSSFANTTRHA